MAVLPTSLSEGALVGNIGPRIEHSSVGAIAGNAIPPEIGDVFGKRRRSKLAAVVTDHTRLHHHPTRRRAKRQGQRRGTAPAKPGAGTYPLSAQLLARVTSCPGGPHDMSDTTPLAS